MKFQAEIFDKLQCLYDITGYNDHQLHCVLRFENNLNAQALKKAVSLLLKVIPILSRVYRNSGGDSFWEDSNNPEWADLFTVVYTEDDFDRFTFSKTDEEVGPQIKVCLLQTGEEAAVSIVLNHMVTDASGFKQCIYLLAEIYSNLIKDPDYVPGFVIDGDRSFNKITKPIGCLSKMRILLFARKDSNQNSGCEFPFSNSEDTSPFIVMHELSPAIYREIKDCCGSKGVKVNDIILTAYLRVLSGLLNMDGKELGIPIMIDMRRYLSEKGFSSLTNISSTTIIRSIVISEEDFSQTLRRVSSEINTKKSKYLGMNTFLQLELLFKLFHKKGYKVLESTLNNPKIGMTNIGILDSKKLVFQNSLVLNAVMCGSIKYRPHFQMSVSTFNDKITFCVNLYGSKADREAILEFFALMDHGLISLAI